MNPWRKFLENFVITKFLSQFIAHDGTPLLNLPYLFSHIFQGGHHMQTGQTKPNWPPYANWPNQTYFWSLWKYSCPDSYLDTWTQMWSFVTILSLKWNNLLSSILATRDVMVLSKNGTFIFWRSVQWLDTFNLKSIHH